MFFYSCLWPRALNLIASQFMFRNCKTMKRTEKSIGTSSGRSCGANGFLNFKDLRSTVDLPIDFAYDRLGNQFI